MSYHMNTKEFPLTGPQKNIWQLEQVNISNKTLNSIYSVLKLPKNINLKLLDKTLNKIREINDSLRLRFSLTENNEVLQYVENFEYKPSRIIHHNSESILEVIENEKNDNLSIFGKLNELAIIVTPYNTLETTKIFNLCNNVTTILNTEEPVLCCTVVSTIIL